MLVGVREPTLTKVSILQPDLVGNSYMFFFFFFFLLCGSFDFILMAKSDQCGHIT